MNVLDWKRACLRGALAITTLAGRLAQTFLFRSATTKLDDSPDPLHFQYGATSQEVEPPA